ncbi:hypothetical protein [Ferrovum sp.]|uniref:NACHT domain-containing protein n=1 Tax=Ferrovum sp. TaxID=2609467 RepID=UPI00260CFCB5|nr:hypothetical protein [Ferrovum sp.]
MSKPDKHFLARRTCTHKWINVEEQESCPLERFRDMPAYVLLGDPGAGKTASFKREAEESGGNYIRARDFATFEPGTEYQGSTLFIDGLDEMRTDGNDGRTPLDHIRKRLDRLGRPKFRLSCREADWLGASDSEALKHVSPNGEIIVLHLDPLNDADIAEILKHKSGVSDPAAFRRQAREHGLDELLRNPQTLNLLVDAVGGKAWPQSRSEIYTMACTKLAGEKNSEHRHAKREKVVSEESLLDAAGYVCAIQLLSGIAGYSLDEESADAQHCCWKELKEHHLPLLTVLKTNLFQSDGEDLRIPVHRSVAEFLGARYIASRIESKGLPFGRVLALMTGEDGGIVADLRGLGAWLSVHCRSGRHALIERDPVGVVLYGDVRNFPAQDKLQVIEAWKREARRYPGFVSERWSSSSSNAAIGALCTRDMETTLREILTSSSREEAEQALLDSVLDAICSGERMPSLADTLEGIVRDGSYWSTVRNSAVAALLHVVPDDPSRLLKLARDIRAGLVEDIEHDLLGMLLSHLYPGTISALEIFNDLHPGKSEHPTGSYSMFWRYGLPKATKKGDLPLLLDKLAEIRPASQNILEERWTNQMAGELLMRGLEEHGDNITVERLYRWLGVGLDKYDHPRLDSKYTGRISAWFAGRSERYKAVIEHGASRCEDHENPWSCLNRCVTRLYASTAPADIGVWYLEKAAAERHAELSRFYFVRSVHWLKQRDGQEELTVPALEFLETWTDAYPKFQEWLEPFITCPVGDWQQEHALGERKRKVERLKRKSELLQFYRKHISAIRGGSANPKIFHDLALAYEGLLLGEAQGETPRDRLESFLADDDELVAAAYSGFRHVLGRTDLPDTSEIIDLELKGKMHYIRSACLIGMEALFQECPDEALRLPDTVLSRLLVFRLSHSVGDDPPWFSALVRKRPALVADAILAYALPMLRAKKEHVSGLFQLVHHEAYAEVARLTLPKLLESFPLRAKANQLVIVLDSLLKGALHYLDQEFLAAMVARKLELSSMDAAQRVYWLGCGLLLAPDVYEAPLFQYVGKSEVRRGYLANFMHGDFGRRSLPDWISIPISVLAHLIELLGPGCSDQPFGGVVTAAMRMSDMVRSYINTLGGHPEEAATCELERLISLSGLSHWRNELRGALHNQRIARRRAAFRRLSVAEVSRTLANLQPACAADLAALTFDHLCDIARKIRDGSTNEYRQYWSYDKSNKKLDEPKPENDCRDALLSDLKIRLSTLGIDAEREGNYADDKRADIKVLFGGASGFNVPVEIKRDTHEDLWRAIHEQLILRYVRDPGADGHGIYLVFWFGGKGMKPPSDGKKLHGATELEERLRQTLTPEESHRIRICVIDCALPS